MPNYTKTNWVNDSTPAINADNLNKIEAGIKANADSINSFIANSSSLGDNDIIKCVTSDGVNLADQANATAGKTLNLSDGSILDFADAKLLPLIRIPWEKYNDGKPRAVIISTSTQLSTSVTTSLRFCTYDKNLNAVYKTGTVLSAEYTTPDGSTRYAQRVYGSNTSPATINNCAYIYVAPENSAFEGTIQVEVQIATTSGEAAIAQADGANYEAFNGKNEKVLDSNIIIDSISQKADKVRNAEADNIVTLNTDGNIKDSGRKIVDTVEADNENVITSKGVFAVTGDVKALTTEHKDNLVDAINELDIESANEIVSLKKEISKTARAILTASCKVGEELITASNTVVGDGWSGDNINGFTHESGKNEPLTFNVNATNGYVYLIEFDCTNLTDGYLLVKMGNSYESQIYNGKEHISTAIQNVTNGGALKIIVSKPNFNGTIKNISCRRIYDGGTYEKTFDVDVVSINDVQNNPTGFWNVVLTKSGFTNTVNSTRTICIGEHALASLIAGNRNVAIGTFALSQLLDGEQNISIGADSMIYVKHGISNIAFGKGVMEYGNTLEHNVAIGENALKGNADSNSKYNVAIGSYAGYYCDKSYNVFIGRNAGYKSRGIKNVAIGDSAYKTNQDGQENTCVGVSSDTNDGVINSIAIGYNVKATKSNQCMIGNESVTEVVLAGKKITFNADHTVTWGDVT